ncbi:unnamed protein product [Leptidea sinapis]|uniref:Tetratricopeptide repeat protein 37 n=1 Tax=Leptidea sinapis TaxID=189913 RepID=A0A5E4QM69_9NEOP|nr:unnamed protein product [Leptidea sinapis]
MADIKTLLKEARKLVDDKEFLKAQDRCKDILRKDKQNYLALILLGKSLGDSDQAPLAYQKAIACKPDLPLAWQGLANYYERKEDLSARKKLITIYGEILKLSLEEEKAIEILSKLGEVGCALKDNSALESLLSYIDKKPNEKLLKIAENEILNLLKADVLCEEKNISCTLTVLDRIYHKDQNDKISMLYGKVILQNNNYPTAVEQIISLEFFTKNCLLREWLCKQICINYVQKDSFSGFDINKYVDKITEGIETSKYPGLLNSMILYDKGLYVEAYKQCVSLINYQDADVTESTFIIKCAVMLKKWQVVEKLALNFIVKVKDSNFLLILKKVLFIALTEQQKWKQAVAVIKDIPISSLNFNEKAALAKCYIEVNEPIDDVIQTLKGTKHFAQLLALSYLKNKKYYEAIVLLEESNDEDSLTSFYLGLAYWELKHYEECLVHFLKSAKLNTDHAETFLYLGHFYYYYKLDQIKAKKCYEKAYSLNALDNVIVRSLSEVYTKLGLADLDYKLLTTASESIEHQTWISFKLGLHYLRKREWENAIIKFRNVIKVNKNDVIAFECLADAYYSRGSYTSALKAYKKVIVLNPVQTSYCLTKIGYIHCLLTQYEDAISTFEEVLRLDNSSLIAIKGIAETWIRIAKKKASAKLYGSSRDSAQYAVNYLVQVLAKDTKFICFWNLLASALIHVTTLPNRFCYVYMSSTVNEKEESIKKERVDIFSQALACYSRAAKLNNQISSYDLASTYLALYYTSSNTVHLHISYKLILSCINSKPLLWRNWNLLGKICIHMKRYDIAQHCFIKALSVTRKWAVAKIWCDLGTLYIKLNHHKLANYCFWRGQSSLPSHPQSWIGQALIAEVIREDEAMDLFRHASILGYHAESALGYVDWLCRKLRNQHYKDNRDLRYVIDGLYAIPYGIDLMEWYLNYKPNDACALNILGILKERSGLLQGALQLYEQAFEYAQDSKKNIVRLNIGRVQSRLCMYDDAITSYKSITEASLDSTCGLALALFNKGLYEEAYAAYDTALHWLSNDDDEKADLLVIMAGIVYKFKGLDDAKTLLFHSIQVAQKKPTAYSLFAICSLGILHSDQGLSKLALSELQKYERNSKFGYDIGFLKSYRIFLNDVDEAIKSISDSVHDHPSDSKLWFCMAQYCLQSSKNKSKIASSCARRAICAIQQKDTQLDIAKILATASIANNMAGEKIKAMSLAKKGLHMYPFKSDIWAVLLFLQLCQNLSHDVKIWTLGVTTFMRKHLNLSRTMKKWISLIESQVESEGFEVN